MATFLDKKEQVYDLKLTPYGRHLLSIGKMKPTYYAFFDDNVTYDGLYMPGAAPSTMGDPLTPEGQNNINLRIKNETPYLESLVLFRDVDASVSNNEGEVINFIEASLTPTQITPEPDIFKFNAAIGDAYLDGETNSAAPAWQVLMMQNSISSSHYRTSRQLNLPPEGSLGYAPGTLVNSPVPQVNIQAIYTLKEAEYDFNFDPSSVRNISQESAVFADGKVLTLEMKDPLIYFNEINTQILTENFEIEVFEVLSGSSAGRYSPTLMRKYFENRPVQIENGMMLSANPVRNSIQSLTTASVEYYFDVLTDRSVNQTIACQGLETFSKESYYIEFDFSCVAETGDSTFYDIYGSVTEPEICQS